MASLALANIARKALDRAVQRMVFMSLISFAWRRLFNLEAA